MDEMDNAVEDDSAIECFWDKPYVKKHQPSGLAHRQLRGLGASAGNQDGVLSEVA